MKKHMCTRVLPFLLATVLLCTLPLGLHAAEVPSAVAYYRSNPTLSDWWEAIALAAAGVDITDGGVVLPPLDGKAVLASGSASALAKAVLSVCALGENPRFAFGEAAADDPVRALARLQRPTGAFGDWINDTIYAVLALELTDPAAYDRYAALDFLCMQQCADGGFAYYGDAGDVDLTGMALLALQFFPEDSACLHAVDRAVAFLAGAMNETGGFDSPWEPGTEPSESVAAALSGLIAVGADVTAAPFSALFPKLQAYRTADGGYAHALGSAAADTFATYQALIAEADMLGMQSAYRAIAQPCGAANQIFADAVADEDAAAAFTALYHAGVIVGRPARNAAADAPLTQAELLVMLDRLCFPGADTGASWYDGAMRRVCAETGCDPAAVAPHAAVSTALLMQYAAPLLEHAHPPVAANANAVTRGEAAILFASLLPARAPR